MSNYYLCKHACRHEFNRFKYKKGIIYRDDEELNYPAETENFIILSKAEVVIAINKGVEVVTTPPQYLWFDSP